MDVGGEHGHDHAALGLLEHINKRLSDLGFAHGMPLALHVGGFAKQGKHALLAEGGKAGQVDGLAVDGGKVHLKVAGHDDGAGGTGDGERYRSGDGVVDVNKTYLEAAQRDFVSGPDDVKRNAGDAVLLKLQIHQRERELGAVKRHGYLAKHVGGRADVIFVPVREEQAADAVLVFDEIGDVRDHKIDAQHILFGEDRAAVHNDHIVAIFDSGNIFSKFIHTAQRDDA